MTSATILAVDDDPVQLQLTEMFLRQAGYTVVTAGGATEAFDKAGQTHVDAIVSDVLMGDLDGFTLCSQFRREPAFRDVPVVLLSAYFHGEEDRRLAASAGAAALIERTPMFEAELATLGRVLQTGAPAYVEQPALPELYIRCMANRLAQFAADMRRSELRYRMLLDHANDAIGVLSRDGVVLDTNRRWERILDLRRDQIVGRHISEFAAPGYEQSNAERYRDTLDAGVAAPVPYPIRRHDGSTLFMEITQAAVEIDGETQVLTIGRDVTDATEARQRLEVSERQYRTLVEHIPDVAWRATLGGRLTFISPRVEAIAGFTPREIYGWSGDTWLGRIHPQDADRVRSQLATLAEASDCEVEFRWQRKDDQWRWIRLRASAIESNGRRTAEGTFADVTDAKGLEEEVRQSQKMEALGQLTGGIAHDFNNLLAIILGNGRMLLDDLEKGDSRRADAEAVIEAAERAASLTRRLLTFSRRQVVQPRCLEVNAVVLGVEKMLRRVIGETTELSIAAAGDAGTIRADAGEIEQVIVNLVLNARDAMPTGGRLHIETSAVELDDAFARAHAGAVPGRYALITVADSGCGMDAETQRHMFEPFFTTKEKGYGTGLGLSTCYGIVKRAGGYVCADSEVGVGTAFKVYLPSCDPEPDCTAPASTVAARGQHSETILVVEDDGPLRGTVARILTRGGYRVLLASDGADAIAVASSSGAAPIDLVLSDVVMPGRSGPEVVEAIRSLIPQVKVLLMSGYTDHPMLRGEAATAFNFIQKPFAPDALAAKVREVLDA